MKFNLRARSWHTWSSLIFALPLLIVGATAVFIAHKKSLGTDDIKLDARWLPGYQTTATKARSIEPRALLQTRDRQILVGTQDGLYRLNGERLEAVPALAEIPVRGLAEASFGHVAATRNGIWLEQSGVWNKVAKGDAWNASLLDDGRIAVAVRDKGFLTSSDGARWQVDPTLSAALAALPAELGDKPLTLNRLVLDLHSGIAFLGKGNEWMWIDLIGLTLCLLAMTGVYMWWRNEKRKSALLA